MIGSVGATAHSVFRLYLPRSVHLDAGHLGVVPARLDVELRGRGSGSVRDLPVRPLHDLAEPLHDHGQIPAAATCALGLSQLQAARLAGGPQEAGPAERVTGCQPDVVQAIAVVVKSGPVLA